MSVTDFDKKLPEGLRYVESRDTRSDHDILQSLTEHKPVISEKNIWGFWHAGVEAMPGWCQRNVINWVRLHGDEWTVRILDSVPRSPNNASAYVPDDMLPDALTKGTLGGDWVGQHSADLLRGACLYLYGGAWIDVGILLFRCLNDICWKQLKDPNSPFEICAVSSFFGGTMTINYFIASRRGSTFIKHWHDLFVYLWRDRTVCDGLTGHPLLAPINEVSAGGPKHFHKTKDFGFNFDASPERTFDYGSQISCFNRVCMLEFPDGSFSGPEYWKTRILLLDNMKETGVAEQKLGVEGRPMLEVLTTRLDSDPESVEYKRAADLVWSSLAQACMQKVFHGKKLLKFPTLGTLLDMPEHGEKDRSPGTFAELLRHGSVHYEQERVTEYKDPPEPEARFRKGLLEP